MTRRWTSTIGRALVATLLVSLTLSLVIGRGGRASAGSGLPFPAGLSANHRYLVDQYGAPYLIVGDSPHSLFVNTSTLDADFYFANRQSHGVNAVWIEALCHPYTGGRPDGSTYDGILPFSTADDFSTPNPMYWARVDTMVKEAADHGITVFLDPVDLAGWAADVLSNGTTKDFGYGAFLGARYKNSPNVVWLHGNDYQNWADTSFDADALAVAQGIASADPNHIQTVELNYFISSSLDDPRWAGVLGLNAAYTYYPTYDEVLHAYGQTPTIPTFMVEANYEGENNTGGPVTNAAMLRRQEWWTMTSGATGQLYGNHTTWTFPTGWKSMLDTPGVAQLDVMRTFFSSEPWQQLVPNASFITSGAGTYDSGPDGVLQSDYATAAVTPDGAHAIAYIPTARTVTVNTSMLHAGYTARWVDPTTGASQPAAAPYTSPGLHPDGASDWALVFDAAVGPPHPSVSLSSTSLNLRYQRVGTVGPPTAVTVTNTGTAPLTITNGYFAGGNSSDFNAHGCVGSPVQPGKSCQYYVSAAPARIGPRHTTLYIVDNAANGPQRIALSVTGTEGLYLGGAAGEVGAFGDGRYFGDATAFHLSAPVVSITTTANGDGYWLLGRDGGVFTYGNAHFYGSTGAVQLSKPIVGMAATPDGRGYWLVASDGGIFSFGDAHFYGSTGAIQLSKPIVGMAATPDGRGYWLAAGDGAVFNYGDAPNLARLAGRGVADAIGIAGTAPPVH